MKSSVTLDPWDPRGPCALWLRSVKRDELGLSTARGLLPGGRCWWGLLLGGPPSWGHLEQRKQLC